MNNHGWEQLNNRVRVTLTPSVEKGEVACISAVHIDNVGCGHPRYLGLSRADLVGMLATISRILVELEE